MRNRKTVLSNLGVPSEVGTDTAWTFEPHPPEYGRKALMDAGWDGETPVLAVCPINPFWWPVKPSTPKFLAHACFGAYKESHYRTIYFHKSGSAVDAAYKKYLGALAQRHQSVSQQAQRLSDSGRHGAAGYAGVRRARAAARRRAGLQLRRSTTCTSS